MLSEMFGEEENVKVGHSPMAGCFEFGDTIFIQLIDFFPHSIRMFCHKPQSNH